ncbi:DUF3558 family protein [Nocardia terpenica]|uniref:DUF3558 family protein n=1 Tax=Nocardia terpenica TaxID=455432 RepID=UPI001895CB35|nr:DUF3558 family protein [Nocardia terpenica]MBF6060493.1 DUF3558 family protein [Nocardia terpenica]MBF6103753.1 DUF3558 family protein [Nocardia terpenica]MBF6111873.1 DUF3558 family protein [Nocardia terpenica]MBF6117974.1 DUF3558 family protein [Nocardia terpenica]MBF6155300.1 DUF3558 family protein [Nocardia terpenica]
MNDTDRHDPAEPLWDPSRISHDVWRQIGVDPSTLTSTIAGFAYLRGFKRCGGHDTRRTYAVDVWSQVSTVDHFEREEAGAEFIPVTIAGRHGLRYRPTSDKTGDQCDLIFPAAQGSYSIVVVRLNPDSPVDPCDRVIEVANIVVPLLPQ